MFIQILIFSNILFGCTESKDLTEPDNVIPEDEQEDEQEMILQLEPGVNELVLEQEVG